MAAPTLIDQLLQGWRPGELFVVYGRPGMGKSSFASQTLHPECLAQRERERATAQADIDAKALQRCTKKVSRTATRRL